MAEEIILPPGVSFAIIAFLLSLLPAGLFLWLWYLRRHDRPVPVSMVTMGFVGGMAVVWPAFFLERLALDIWVQVSPHTAHYYSGAILPLQVPSDFLLPAIGTFLVVATVEEGLRYLFLTVWFRFSQKMDQVFDGLVVGLAAGLGFATVENTIYFWNLFTQGSFDTLVFVFFLRFMISTLAHISFGGMMGVLLARGIFGVYRSGALYAQAFFLPWFMHGLYDLLLGINQTLYAVLMLVPALLILISWADRRDFFAINRENGERLVMQRAPETKQVRLLREFFKRFESPWNAYAPWLRERRVDRDLLHKLEDRM